MNGLNQTLHVRNGSAGTSCRLSTFLALIRCCTMSNFTLSRCGEAAAAGLVHHETSKVARRVSCGRPEPWHASRFSAHIASAPLWVLGTGMGSAPHSAVSPRPQTAHKPAAATSSSTLDRRFVRRLADCETTPGSDRSQLTKCSQSAKSNGKTASTRSVSTGGQSAQLTR